MDYADFIAGLFLGSLTATALCAFLLPRAFRPSGCSQPGCRRSGCRQPGRCSRASLRPVRVRLARGQFAPGVEVSAVDLDGLRRVLHLTCHEYTAARARFDRATGRETPVAGD